MNSETNSQTSKQFLIQTPIKETFLQKLLGQNYKYFFIIRFYFKSNTVYRWNSLMWLLGSLVMVLGTLLVWYINFSQNPNFQNQFSEIFTYFIVGEALIFGSAIQFDIGENI